MFFRKYLLILLPLLVLYSCFTGIESTPRITDSDVRRQHITTTPEQAFLADVSFERPSLWQPGKRFYVTDPKISLVLSSDSPIDAASLVGHDLVFVSISPSRSYLGQDMATIEFKVADTGLPVAYKTQVPYEQLSARDFYDIPFAIDRDIVARVADKLQGATYFITTPLWYDPSGQYAVQGLRHIEVCVDSVVPGNSIYPIRVIFHEPVSGAQAAVYMTVGDRRTATRNFDTLFAFDDPRKRYQNISDEDWSLITHSRVRIGMTKDECRLALGTPTTMGQRPTTAGMVEYWSYADGVYLLFEDGYLSSFRR